MGFSNWPAHASSYTLYGIPDRQTIANLYLRKSYLQLHIFTQLLALTHKHKGQAPTDIHKYIYILNKIYYVAAEQLCGNPREEERRARPVGNNLRQSLRALTV